MLTYEGAGPLRAGAADSGVRAVTLLAVLALVTRVTDAGSGDAGAMVTAGEVDALTGGHVALSRLPAAVTHAAPFQVLAVTAAQHRAGG